MSGMKANRLPSAARPMTPAITRREWISAVGAGAASSALRSLACAQETGRAEPGLAGYDELMEHVMREHKPPGAALAVTYRGRLVYARGFGHADLEKHQPVEPG